MQQGVSVVKASAGSGKTYRLTHDYIDLLLSGDEQGYKHILAVTFTNKATEEMKSRVIEELYKLSVSGDPDAGLAADRLRRMLHDYSCFSVSTIDKFFQSVMRAFAREIGQYASYRVELDTEAVLDQVVDLMLDSIEDPERETLLKWLKEYSFDQVEQGEGWNISRPLKNMAKQFLDESFLIRMREAGRGDNVLGDKESLKAFLKRLDGIIAAYDNEAVAIGKEGMQLLGSHGISPDGLFKKSRGPAMIFTRWAERDFSRPCPGEDDIRKTVEGFPDPAALSALFDRVKNHFGEPLKLSNTARLIRRNLYLLGIYGDLQHLLDDYLRENNVVLLQLSNDILSRIIADDDTPFVYEKIGVRYENLMLDEAQDTSLMQWNNFRPLFINSQASGGRNLVVGDIKQSIYRWRGSDWRLMRDYLSRDLSYGTLWAETLSENWRSGIKLIDFNNGFFSHVGDVLASDPERAGLAPEVQAIYSDCVQQLPDKHKDDPQGYVRLEFLDQGQAAGNSWKEEALKRMVEDIRELHDEGYGYKDITVIVRWNREGAQVAQTLIDAGISVITEDSLQIGGSPCISQLMSLLGWMVDPDDPVNELQSRNLRDGLPECKAGSLYETCEQLLGCGIIVHDRHDLPFINAFLDAALAFQEKYGSSLRAFVKWWEDAGHKQPICAPAGQDAVRVMTVHKAKGLSIDAVVIPFCAESFAHSGWHQPTLWCKCPEQLDGPALIPLKVSSAMKDSLFEAEYEEERTLKHIDVINTWYVAFTRARTRLLIYAPKPGPSSKGKDIGPSGIENTLYLHFRQKLEENVFEDGKRETFIRKEETSSLVDDPLPGFVAAPSPDGRLRLSLHGEDYFSQEKSARRRGIEQHGEMARVETDPDLEVRSGNRHWFDGTFRVMNEASIVTGEGEIYRPDRVLISSSGDKVIVIDYKFGEQRPAHHRQVRNYVKLMQEMGYPSVEGWLWYVTEGEILQA